MVQRDTLVFELRVDLKELGHATLYYRHDLVERSRTPEVVVPLPLLVKLNCSLQKASGAVGRRKGVGEELVLWWQHLG